MVTLPGSGTLAVETVMDFTSICGISAVPPV